MRRFTRLYLEIDQTTRTSEKVEALRSYFAGAPAADAAWALMALSGRRLLRTVGSAVLRETASEVAGLPQWLVDECYGAVGDFSETIALLLPAAREPAPDLPLHRVFAELIVPMGRSDPGAAAAILRRVWGILPRDQVFVFHKLISGTFRVGVQRRLLVRALAEASGVDVDLMAHRLTGEFAPTAESYLAIMSPRETGGDAAKPYPFCLAHQLDAAPQALGDAADWFAEWKWDGIRAQLIRREGGAFLWSRGEGVISHQFPEVMQVGAGLPVGTVIDGEVMAWSPGPGGGTPLRFKQLQTRLGRKDQQPGLFDQGEVVFMAFDLLERAGQDIRSLALAERRAGLASIVEPLMARGLPVRLSGRIAGESWEQLGAARADAAESRHAEGLMLKHKDSAYHVGRTRGDARHGGAGWWKWKVDPYTLDAVLLYAQPGSGKRAGLFTDYTFALRDGEDLVPFAKAYSGLTDEEIREVDAFIRGHTLDRRGPVRFVEPALVFEIAFQEVHVSKRHRAGAAVRFPRIVRWRRDKGPQDADTIGALRGLLNVGAAVRPAPPAGGDRPARPSAPPP